MPRSDVGGSILSAAATFRRLDALQAVYARLENRIVVDNESLLSVGGFPTATATGSDIAGIAAAAGVPRTATARTLDEFTRAFDEALAAGQLTTIVAKVEAVGPSAYVTGLSLLENRFEFQKYLNSTRAARASES